jgi:hypothetical protein
VKRAESPDFLESIANDPRVRPYIGGTGEMRAGETWQHSVGLEWDTGGIVFMHQGDGVYDAHLLFLPGTWGVVGKCRKALQYLFTRTNARKLVVAYPSGYDRVTRVVKACGLEHIKDEDGLSHYAISARNWIRSRS